MGQDARRGRADLVAGYIDITPQERQITRLARDGLSNPEIGTRLFLSARTDSKRTALLQQLRNTEAQREQVSTRRPGDTVEAGSPAGRMRCAS